jgi:hypothetical protein
MKQKLYLRKASSNPAEYEALASTHGFTGEWSVLEWAKIEGREAYRSVPSNV